MARRDRERRIDRQRVVNHLKHMFNAIVDNMDRATRDTKTNKVNERYRLEQDMAYYIDEIERGPEYQLPKVIDDCNAFIAKLEETQKRDAQ